MANNICPKCGCETNQNNFFCPNCGARINFDVLGCEVKISAKEEQKMQKYATKLKKYEEKSQQADQWIANNKKAFAAIVTSAVAMLLVVILTVSILSLYTPPEGFEVSINEDGSLTILRCVDRYASRIEIPSELKYGGKMRKVTSIGGYAFTDCTNLTSIVIPDCVTYFSDWAFWGCDLYEVRYMGSISDWCVIAFGTNSNPLECADKFYVNGILIEGELILPDTSIGYRAFYGFNALTSVTIGKNATIIADSAFQDCDNLTSVTIGENVTSIGDSAFRDCDNLTSVTIGENVTSIGSWAFADCDNLTSVVFEDPYGWNTLGTPLVLTNAAKNATYLSDYYRSTTWTKS